MKRNHLIIVGSFFPADFHLRLCAASEKLNTGIHIVTPETIKCLSERMNITLDEALGLIEGLSAPKPKNVNEDLKNTFIEATAVFDKLKKELLSIDADNRPFYQRLNEKRGKKGAKRW